MNTKIIKYKSFFLMTTGILVIFLIRTLLASRFPILRLNDIFTIITIAGSVVVVISGFNQLRRRHLFCALIFGLAVGFGMRFATLFTPYPFLGFVRSNPEQALVRGLLTSLAVAGGIVIQQKGGPVKLLAACGNWQKSFRGIFVGLVVGLPLSLINVLALKFTQGHPISWQNPLSALLDALQPAIVEEVLFRFALWSLLWVILNKSIPEKAIWLSGVLSMLVHNYQHFDDLFLQSPLIAIGMGAVMALLWGIPPLILAHRRGLESAISFHWIQDVTRFLTGF